ncbi:CDP-alcohol phosphatidyltransferase family protein [Arthrobacter sp. CAN_A1]|uniref:CDP-alcohol phosphatidyltransferase family protein n=1 Tax=Arthrobacter sp. CAN_A1 TaxID=2787717 RepID=UPI0018CAE189
MIRLIGAGARPGHENDELATFWTLPNIITVIRFLGVPLFVYLIVNNEDALAVITLVVLGSTDWVDGYIARRFNQVSSVGKWLDPIADRTALIVIAVVFVVDGIAPAWLVWTIVIPDAILILNALILFRGPLHLPVTNVGKIRTALLLIGSPMLLLYRVPGFDLQWLLVAANILLVLGCIGHLIAFYGYFTAAHRKYRSDGRSGGSAQPGAVDAG